MPLFAWRSGAIPLVAIVFLALAACGGDPATEASSDGTSCEAISCPVGTSPKGAKSASGSGSASGSTGLTGGNIQGEVFGEGACQIECVPPRACCEGEEWTATSYKCAKPCAEGQTPSGEGAEGTVEGLEGAPPEGGEEGAAEGAEALPPEGSEGASGEGREGAAEGAEGVEGAVEGAEGAAEGGEGGECVPLCDGKVCGPDGCGGECGECGEGTQCKTGKCVAKPECEGKPCGADDGAGGKCTAACPVWSNKPYEAPPDSPLCHAMAYDAANQQTVIFGGTNNGAQGNATNATWVWDGAVWKSRSVPEELKPRAFPAMVYAPTMGTGGAAIMFGGGDGGGGFYNDTWSWDGFEWTEIDTATDPPARWGHMMAYDTEHGSVVLFGGQNNDGLLNDTWAFDGTDWKQQSPTKTPPARRLGAMAYDGNNLGVMLFGGDDGAIMLDDTWLWDGNDWLLQKVAVAPPGRHASSAAYDAKRGRVVLWGGSENEDRQRPTPFFPNGPQLLDDTWEWDGLSWVEVQTPSAPPPRMHHQMVYREATGKVEMIGGGFGVALGNWFVFNTDQFVYEFGPQ